MYENLMIYRMSVFFYDYKKKINVVYLYLLSIWFLKIIRKDYFIWKGR